jgi:uncharacterized membrane protein YsdA (DUF1294 family)
VAIYAVGTSLEDGPGTNRDFYRAAATVLLAVVVLGGETGALMTLAREKTNWAAHLYVCPALISLGLLLLYLALVGPDRFAKGDDTNGEDD